MTKLFAPENNSQLSTIKKQILETVGKGIFVHSYPTTSFKPGYVVIICDQNVARSQWRKGVITATYPAKDGHIRIVEVKTATGLLRRPVSKLARLDVL